MADGFPYRAVADRLLAGNVIPFLGAGASMYHRSGAGDKNSPPTGTELSEVLAELAGYSGEDDLANYPCRVTTCCKRSKRFEELVRKQVQDLPRVASILEHVKADWGALKDCLNEQFNKDFIVNELYKLLAGIASKKPLLIITTNYDDLLERAFDDAMVPYHWVSTVLGVPERPIAIRYRPPTSRYTAFLSPSKLDVTLDEHSIIYKMHGSIDRSDLQEHSFIITEEHYVAFLTRMSKDLIPRKIGKMFTNKSFLFLGYSLCDWNIRVMLEGIPKHHLEHWAVLRSVSDVDKTLWIKKRIKPFDIDLNVFTSMIFSEIIRSRL